jgi:RNA polymerase sigma factor (sigma-70 family)
LTGDAWRPEKPQSYFRSDERRWHSLSSHAIVTAMRRLEISFRRVKRLLLRGGASREDAEDLIQEAVLRLHAFIKGGNEVRDEHSFVQRTAMNLAVDAHRRAHADLWDPSPVEKLELADLAPTPDEVLQAEQRLLRISKALDRVSVRTREIFLMHRLQGFSHAEIAAKFGVTKSAIEKHIASAFAVLMIERAKEERRR